MYRGITLHDLVKTDDGYYALITRIFSETKVEVFQSNGLRCDVDPRTLFRLGIQDGSTSPANFAELMNRK